ncbi:MAG: metallophosphoesterase [Bacteroidota bacterium]
MNAILFFIVFVLILSVGYGYVGVRFILPMHLPIPWNIVAWSILVTLLIIPAAGIFISFNRVEHWWSIGSAWVAYVSLGLFSFLFTLTLLKDLGVGAWTLWEKLRPALDASGMADAVTDPERRRILVRGFHLSLLGVAGGLTGFGILEARRRPAIVEVSIPLPALPAAFDGFRIVQITDIHAGLTVTRPFVETVVEMANELHGDLVAFTGDLADGSVSHLREHVVPMARLVAPYGKFFVTGNHEYYSGAEAWVEEAKRLGFDTLINEHRVIHRNGERLVLAGVTDVNAVGFVPHHRSDPAAAVAEAPAGVIKILLAHQPRSLEAAQAAGVDLMLSGHTHGGQFFPWNLVAAAGQPLLKGLRQFGSTWVYVSKGTGYWGPPIRLGSRSEITVITLRRAAHA